MLQAGPIVSAYVALPPFFRRASQALRWALSAQLTVVRNTRSSDVAVGQYL
jgi:hypothetical protein